MTPPSSLPPMPRPWRPTPVIALALAVHGVALLLLLVSPGHWLVLLGICLGTQLVLAVIGMTPGSRLLGPNLRRVGEIDTPTVYLTLDDGPDPEVTPRVLDLLDQHGARATFFLIGERARRHGELVREIVRRGHGVENHSDRHAYTFGFWTPGRLRADLERAQQTLEELTGRKPHLFRAPAGIRSPLLEPVLCRLGLHLVSWTRRGFDTADTDPRRILRRLLDGLAPGDVLLLHDGSGRSGSCPVVLEVLPELLKTLEDRGLRVTALPPGLP